MTPTIFLNEEPPQADTASHTPRHPADVLMNLVVALLAPMFLCVTNGDVGMARMAAFETVNAHRARTHPDLLAVAQIIAFGLAALGSLSLSMADDVSLAMTLRLRGNAVALNRSAEQNRRAIGQSRGGDPMSRHAETAAVTETSARTAEGADPAPSEPFLSAQAAQALAAESADRLRGPEQAAGHATVPAPAQIPVPATTEQKRHEEMWAIAMVQESGEIAASIPNLPPTERRAATLRAAALSSTANQLLAGASSPPVRPHGQGTPTQPNTI